MFGLVLTGEKLKKKTMKKLAAIIGLFLVFAIVGTSQTSAVRKEILRQSCSDAEIKVVKIGPAKSGYLASCPASGANRMESVYENTHKLYDGAAITFLKTSHLGYYDLSEFAYSPRAGYTETKTWNGSRYVRKKCQQFDITSRGKSVNYRPCSF